MSTLEGSLLLGEQTIRYTRDFVGGDKLNGYSCLLQRNPPLTPIGSGGIDPQLAAPGILSFETNLQNKGMFAAVVIFHSDGKFEPVDTGKVEYVALFLLGDIIHELSKRGPDDPEWKLLRLYYQAMCDWNVAVHFRKDQRRVIEQIRLLKPGTKKEPGDQGTLWRVATMLKADLAITRAEKHVQFIPRLESDPIERVDQNDVLRVYDEKGLWAGYYPHDQDFFPRD